MESHHLPPSGPSTAGIELRLRLKEGTSPEHQCSTEGKQSWLNGKRKNRTEQGPGQWPRARPHHDRHHAPGLDWGTDRGSGQQRLFRHCVPDTLLQGSESRLWTVRPLTGQAGLGLRGKHQPLGRCILPGHQRGGLGRGQGWAWGGGLDSGLSPQFRRMGWACCCAGGRGGLVSRRTDGSLRVLKRGCCCCNQ